MSISPVRVANLYLLASSGFDPAEFKALKTESLLALREKYLLGHGCKLLGHGAYRNVYDLGDRVMKLTKASARPNIKEINTSKCLSGSKVIARVLDHAEDGSWLIAEKAKLFSSQAQWLAEINKSLNLPGHLRMDDEMDFITLMDLYTSRSTKDARVLWVRANPTPWWKDIYAAVNEGSCALDVFDAKFQNWGKIGGRLVMVDYGGDEVE